MVSFMDDRIWLMEVIVSPLPISEKTKGISINESRSLAKSLIPFDAKLMKTYTNRSGSTVDLYMSEALNLFSSVDFDRTAVSSMRERACIRTGGSPNG